MTLRQGEPSQEQDLSCAAAPGRSFVFPERRPLQAHRRRVCVGHVCGAWGLWAALGSSGPRPSFHACRCSALWLWGWLAGASAKLNGKSGMI